MRRTPVVFVAYLLLALGSSASAAEEPPAPGPERPSLAAALAACGTGATEDERFAVFTGSMPARRGTRAMWMRFDVYERRGRRARWQRLDAPAFGRWERSEPDRAGFVWTKRVERLRDRADYRAVVRFRWYDAAGDLQTRRRRTTAVCRQPDRRADLRVQSVGVLRGPDAATYRYLVTVANTGLLPAGPFDVAVTAGSAHELRAVAGLKPGHLTRVEIVAPQCEPDARVVARADVGDAVDEGSERNNAHFQRCPGR